MSVFAIVPVKGLGVSKRRLSNFLSPQDRKLLTETMLIDVLKALKSSKINKIVVVSGDLNVRSIVDKLGVLFFSPSRNGLNPAIAEATDWCLVKQASSVLVVPADIPLLSSRDVNRIVDLGTSKALSVVLSPSNNGGTNALFRNPANVITPSFGDGSFVRHFRRAKNKDVSIKIYYSNSVGFDIDSHLDLRRLCKNSFSSYPALFPQEAPFKRMSKGKKT